MLLIVLSRLESEMFFLFVDLFDDCFLSFWVKLVMFYFEDFLFLEFLFFFFGLFLDFLLLLLLFLEVGVELFG